MAQPKAKLNKEKREQKALYESETAALQSLRLIAAPNAKDDLTDQQLWDICRSQEAHSSEMINHLIEFIKSI